MFEFVSRVSALVSSSSSTASSATVPHALRQACLYSLVLLLVFFEYFFSINEMPRLTFLAGVILVSLGLVPLMTTSRAADISASQSSMERRYSTPHSLGDSYQFDPRDGWESVNITNLQYKYSRSLADSLEDPDGPTIPRAHTKRASKKASKSSTNKTAKKTTKTTSKAAKTAPKSAKTTTSSAKSAANGLLGSVKSVVDSMKAIGEPEPVTITWYTGHDLLNPSCWSTTTWTPTVRSISPSFVPIHD